MTMHNALYGKEKFKNLDADLRIGIIISDGMWYSLPKWRKLSRTSEEEINAWIKKETASGRLIQSPTGAKSYRFPLTSIESWYSENNLEIGQQLIEKAFPPRIWGGMTETEGLLKAPLREVGVVSFSCSPQIAKIVIEELRGIARVRQINNPGDYKAYCLDPTYVKPIIENIFTQHDANEREKIAIRTTIKRRELVDLPVEFRNDIVVFYKNFAKSSLLKNHMETIKIFLPENEDQETQIIMWVIEAIEKFNELEAVPFSGYLSSVLNRWPYNLPVAFLGKDLSDFQRSRSKAIKKLKKETGRTDFTVDELCKEMGCSKSEFINLDEKHKIWIATKTATSLTWDENSEEKQGEDFTNVLESNGASDTLMAHKLSLSVIKTALDTELYYDALAIISQIDNHEVNLGKINEVSDTFIQALGYEMGMIGE